MSCLDHGSLAKLAIDLNGRGVRTKRTLWRDGGIRGGVQFQKSALSCLLRNRTYVGDVVHRGQHYGGEQEAIVPSDLFEAIQQKLTEQVASEGGVRVNTGSPLICPLYDNRGNCDRGHYSRPRLGLSLAHSMKAFQVCRRARPAPCPASRPWARPR
ncbi:recombinase family protein [Labrys okinawensis]|uniref:recombinase family protein n=1 Tax=Labrys okinawensis TaxID=346911 RepID=UPI0039BD31CC